MNTFPTRFHPIDHDRHDALFLMVNAQFREPPRARTSRKRFTPLPQRNRLEMAAANPTSAYVVCASTTRIIHVCLISKAQTGVSFRGALCRSCLCHYNVAIVAKGNSWNSRISLDFGRSNTLDQYPRGFVTLKRSLDLLLARCH